MPKTENEVWEEFIEDDLPKGGKVAGICLMAGILLFIILGFVIANSK